MEILKEVLFYKLNFYEIIVIVRAFGAVGSASERHSEGHKFESCNAHLFFIFWGVSAVGSARHWQCRGQGFESPTLQILYFQ